MSALLSANSRFPPLNHSTLNDLSTNRYFLDHPVRRKFASASRKIDPSVLRIYCIMSLTSGYRPTKLRRDIPTNALTAVEAHNLQAFCQPKGRGGHNFTLSTKGELEDKKWIGVLTNLHNYPKMRHHIFSLFFPAVLCTKASCHLGNLPPPQPDSTATVVNRLQQKRVNSVTLCITLNANTGKIVLVTLCIQIEWLYCNIRLVWNYPTVFVDRSTIERSEVPFPEKLLKIVATRDV